jgi:peptidoglycan hydrolase-like protein with peptidoglycan-binding domain
MCRNLFAVAALGFLVSACDGGDVPQGQVELKATGSDLTAGSQGDEVRAVHQYLTRFGYFPNQAHAEHYARWRPIVAKLPAQLGTYDGSTVEAVRAFQTNFGLPVTGIVDARTRAAMRQPRCGVPDGIAPLDSTDKFGTLGSSLSSRTFNWKVVNGAPAVTQAQGTNAAATGFSQWAAETGLSFPELFGAGSPGIQITFASIDGRATINADGSVSGGVLAHAVQPSDGSDMTIDSAENWSVATPTPPDAVDLFSVVLHELGHSIGLAHSGIPSAVMYPGISFGEMKRNLDTDDKAGASLLYDRYGVLAGGKTANDIGVGKFGDVWITGGPQIGGQYQVFKWNGSGWDASNGFAVRIAVEPSGGPWVVTNANTIYRHSTSNPATGTWDLMPGTANDIGIGNDGSVWITGGPQLGGQYQVFKWNGSGWDASDGFAVRIAVGPTGNPWVVTNANTIYRHTTNSPFSGSWELLPDRAYDIGISDGNVAWKVLPNGSSTNLSVWEEQPFADGGPPASALRQWRSAVNFTTTSNGISVSVGPGARPFVINGTGAILSSFQ